MASYWSLSVSKFPQVSRTLLSILADFNNALVWMTSTFPLISKSSRPFTEPLGIVPNAPITIFRCFFNSLSRSKYLLLLFVCLFVLIRPWVSPLFTIFSKKKKNLCTAKRKYPHHGQLPLFHTALLYVRGPGADPEGFAWLPDAICVWLLVKIKTNFFICLYRSMCSYQGYFSFIYSIIYF